MPFDASSFFARYAKLEPEEATTLGLSGHEGQLRDQSPAGYESRYEFYCATRTELNELAESDSGLNIHEATLLRHCEFEIYAHEHGFQAANPQWATYPHTTTLYLAAQKRATAAEISDPESVYAKRAQQIPEFLRHQEAQLLKAGAHGLVAHEAFLRSLIDYELVAARDFFQAIHEPAAAAFEAHRDFLEKEMIPHAPRTALLGAKVYAERLFKTYHIKTPLADLVSQAESALKRLQTEMISLAPELGLGDDVKDFAVIRDYMIASQKETLPAKTDIEAHYRKIMKRAMAHLVAHSEFQSTDLNQLGMDHYPEGMRDKGSGTNWPAPLFDRQARGQFVIHPDPAAHSAAWANVFAAHEGAPGHFLQSEGFRKHFKTEASAIGFLAIADDVAIPRLNFCSMLNIEGYAVYAEECLRSSGFHSGRDQLFALAAHALRAVRVIGEINLHRGVFNAEECERFILDNAGLPSAFWELQRYQRGPLQAVAYFFGSEEFRALRAAVEAQRGDSFSAADFHEEIFAYGPALPADIRVEMLK